MDVSTVSPSTSTASRDTATARAATAQSGSSSGSSAQATTTSSASDYTSPPGGPPYTSPTVGFDTGTGTAILEFRDQSSGQLEFQLPSRTALQYAGAVATTPTPKTISDVEKKSGGDVLA
ncbi:hypothetical protein [Magnetospirillum fulvum]|uniref:hypothetical protein n=1 Tax=Magnetospirillum fulvum TaxID=1082 RepID=UPI0012DEE464|nr:hypothetical protein [Magnetospirillum fulvum]